MKSFSGGLRPPDLSDTGFSSIKDWEIKEDFIVEHAIKMSCSYSHLDKWLVSQCNYFTMLMREKFSRAPELLTTKQKCLLDDLQFLKPLIQRITTSTPTRPPERVLKQKMRTKTMRTAPKPMEMETHTCTSHIPH